MATLTPEAMADLIASTLPQLDRLSIVNLATTLQKYEVMGVLAKKDKVTYGSGRSLQWQVMVDHAHSAKQVGLYEPDTINTGDYLATGTVPWRFMTDNWAYEYREALMNRGDSRIVDELAARKAAFLISQAEHLEAAFWSSPIVKTDVLKPYGIYYWMTKNATEGFNGADNLIFDTGRGLIDANTYARAKNWTAPYVNVTKDDLIAKMRKAFVYCDWQMPVQTGALRREGTMNRIYTNYEILALIERVGENQNENLGKDIASMDGQIVFRRIPIVSVPYLDNDTDDPVFMLNMDDFALGVLQGDFFRTTGPVRADGYHNCFVFHTDLTYNFIAKNFRTHAVLSKGIAYPATLYV